MGLQPYGLSRGIPAKLTRVAVAAAMCVSLVAVPGTAVAVPLTETEPNNSAAAALLW